MAGGRRRQQQQRRRDERQDPRASDEQDHDRGREAGLGSPDLSEASSQDGREDVPAERVAEPEAACLRSLDDDPGHGDRGEPAGADRKEA